MKVLIFGASGFIGRNLIPGLLDAGHHVIAVTRNMQSFTPRIPNLPVVELGNEKAILSSIRESDAVINLAGASLARSWTKANKIKIVNSRIGFSKHIVDLIKKSGHKPEVFLQGSAIGIYGDEGETELTDVAHAGRGFLASVVKRWENAIASADLQCRKVFLRTGLVMGKDGGMLPLMIMPVKWFVGGHFGNGQQWFPWIHIRDEVRAIRMTLENEKVEGPVNLVSPGIVRQKDFMKKLAAKLKRPSWFHVPAFVLKSLMGAMADEMLLSSQRVIPEKLLKNGFTFEFANADAAMENLIGKAE